VRRKASLEYYNRRRIPVSNHMPIIWNRAVRSIAVCCHLANRMTSIPEPLLPSLWWVNVHIYIYILRVYSKIGVTVTVVVLHDYSLQTCRPTLRDYGHRQSKTTRHVSPGRGRSVAWRVRRDTLYSFYRRFLSARSHWTRLSLCSRTSAKANTSSTCEPGFECGF